MCLWLCGFCLHTKVSHFTLITVALIAIPLLALLGRPRLARWRNPFEGVVQSQELLNEAEVRLYRLLREAVPECYVLPQVALSQVIRLRRGAPRELFNRYDRLVADFVVCTAQFTPLAVVELDGRTHQRRRQKERDRRKDQVVLAAGLKMFRIRARGRWPSAFEIRAGLRGR